MAVALILGHAMKMAAMVWMAVAPITTLAALALSRGTVLMDVSPFRELKLGVRIWWFLKTFVNPCYALKP